MGKFELLNNQTATTRYKGYGEPSNSFTLSSTIQKALPPDINDTIIDYSPTKHSNANSSKFIDPVSRKQAQNCVYKFGHSSRLNFALNDERKQYPTKLHFYSGAKIPFSISDVFSRVIMNFSKKLPDLRSMTPLWMTSARIYS
jgi:hypothetical protein